MFARLSLFLWMNFVDFIFHFLKPISVDLIQIIPRNIFIIHSNRRMQYQTDLSDRKRVKHSTEHISNV